MNKVLALSIRKFTSRLVFVKRLPSEFGRARVFVTPRADLRLLYHGYEKSAFDLMLVARNYIKPGQCIWDIGSNLGIFSACAAFKSGPSGEIFSLEADPKYASLQNQTFSALPSNFSPVHVLCAAAADRNGVLNFAVSRQGHARSHLAEVEGQKAVEIDYFQSVLSISLDYLLEYWKRPKFVKIDVEGAESLVIEGAKGLLTEVRPIFYIEVSDRNKEPVTELFLKADYEIFKLEGDGSETPIKACELYTIVKPKEFLT